MENKTDEQVRQEVYSVYTTGKYFVDLNNQLFRKIKRLIHPHKWIWEYHVDYKKQFCAGCGKLGKTTHNNTRTKDL